MTRRRTYIVHFKHASEGNLAPGLELEMDCVEIGEEADIYEVIVSVKVADFFERQLDHAENVIYYYPAPVQSEEEFAE